MSSTKVIRSNQLLQNTRQNEQEINYNELCVLLMNRSQILLSFPQRLSSVTADEVLNKIYINNKQLNIDPKYKDLFAIWITSTYLELQLQPKHKPFNVLAKWDSYLEKYGPIELFTNQELIEKDEPTLSFQRNVFSHKLQETGIELKDILVLRLLYEESKLNVLDGKYPIDSYEELAAIQAAIDLGPFDSNEHSVEYFKQHLNDYIPSNYNKTNGLIRTLSLNSHSSRCAQQIVKEFKNISKDETNEYKLLRKYMEICWSLPFYGSAYFSAQIERPAKSSFASLVNHFDLKVWVAINREGIHVISKESPELLLSVQYKDLYFAIGCSTETSNPECIPCLFIQIPDNSNNNNKILQIFSRQIKLIESLLNSFIEEQNNTEDTINHNTIELEDYTDGSQTSRTPPAKSSTSYTSSKPKAPKSPCNFKKLSFAEFDNFGHCINKTGSWVRKK